MKVTADNLTEEQIRDVLCVAERECRVPRVQYISIDAPSCVGDLIAANWALGNVEDWYLDDTGYFHRVGGNHAAKVHGLATLVRNGRARIAELLNARAKEAPRHAVNEHGDCAQWCKACRANVARGLNPDGTAKEAK